MVEGEISTISGNTCSGTARLRPVFNPA